MLMSVTTCPLGAQLGPFLSVRWVMALGRYAFYMGNVIMLLLMIGVAFLFLVLTLATFNRSMGRMPERPRRAPGRQKSAKQRARRTHPQSRPASTLFWRS